MASRKKTTSFASIHILHVELVDSRPAIWRELHVPSDMSLSKLHDVLQAAFAWTNSHLHVFEDKSRQQYGPTGAFDDFGFGEAAPKDERKVAVADVAPKAKDMFGYIYDFGDDWVHRITVEEVRPPEPGMKYPACTDGKRAAPPDDCGGLPGYERMLRILKNSRHEEYEDMLEWTGGPLDPAAFDLDATAKAVRKAV